MHPAFSIILFTVSSGAGYGMLALLGLLGPLGLVPDGRGFAVVAFGGALGLVTFGLVSSLLHLGRPERAWRALSQWRSSWLSREGVAATATYVPALLYALSWAMPGGPTGAWALAGIALAAGALATVACTGMIYQSLRAVPRWHRPETVVVFILFALVTGGLWLGALTRLFEGRLAGPFAVLLPLLLLALWLAKMRWWQSGDLAGPVATAGSATGLGGIGRVRLVEPPHATDNYLTREMGFRIARKHAFKLRRITILTAFALPLALTVATIGSAGPFATAAAVLAALSASAGAIVERWLFFAEARHTTSLYYGTEAV